MRAAVIPARGGSKRIPRKNVRNFAGKPMIAHSIEVALASKLFDRVIVSTDDEEIVAVSRAHGAEVPFIRPASLADDYSGTTPVVAHAVEWLQRQGGIDPEAVCCIYATAPFVTVHDLAQGLSQLLNGSWDYVFSATTYSSPVFRSFRRSSPGGLEMLFPRHFETRSQDLDEVFHDAGQFYWGRARAWIEQREIFGAKSDVVPLPRWRVQDIDTPEDWERAERLHKSLSATH